LLFLGNSDSKIDKKGRLSIPAAFRSVLASMSGEQEVRSIVVFPSLHLDAIEVCHTGFVDRIYASVAHLPLFSPERDNFASVIFGSSQQLPVDVTGRIQLPQRLLDHAGIGDEVTFVGQGDKFQIWQPEAYRAHFERARAELRQARSSLNVPSSGAAGGAA